MTARPSRADQHRPTCGRRRGARDRHLSAMYTRERIALRLRASHAGDPRAVGHVLQLFDPATGKSDDLAGRGSMCTRSVQRRQRLAGHRARVRQDQGSARRRGPMPCSPYGLRHYYNPAENQSASFWLTERPGSVPATTAAARPFYTGHTMAAFTTEPLRRAPRHASDQIPQRTTRTYAPSARGRDVPWNEQRSVGE